MTHSRVLLKTGVIRNSLLTSYKAKHTLEGLTFETLHHNSLPHNPDF